MTKHNLELFSADCKLCEHTINVLEQATKDNKKFTDLYRYQAWASSVDEILAINQGNNPLEMAENIQKWVINKKRMGVEIFPTKENMRQLRG